jgi:putative transposase
VLFFIELASRRVHLGGITTNPDGRWVSQQARNLLMQLDDEGARPRFLVRDRDGKFTREFDEVFRSEGIRVIKAPVRAPKARAHAERWVGTVRRECLDRLLILGRRHLQHVINTYSRHYNEHRPHELLRQLVADGGNGFGLFPPSSSAVRLRLIGTGCNHGAP